MLVKVKFIKLFIVGVFICLIFLWSFLLPSGKYNYNIIVLIAAIICFICGLVGGDFILSGLLIPVGNGLSRLAPHPYPTTSFLCFCLFLGFLLSVIKKKGMGFTQIIRNDNIIVNVAVGFWIIMMLSGIFHVLTLISPGKVFIVNRAEMTNIQIVYHIIVHILFPLSCGIFLFLLTKNFLNKEEKFFLMLSIGCIISSVVGILQSLGVVKEIFGYIIPWEPRINGLFSDFNSFSLSLALLIPVFCYFFLNVDSFVKKTIFLIASGLGFICLFLTGTKSGILLLIFFLFIYIIFQLLQGKYKLIISISIGVIILLFIILIVSKIFDTGKIYPINRIKMMFIQSSAREIIEGRKLFWNTGLKVWKKNILFGNGIKSVYKEFSNINPAWIPSDNACNTYIHFLAEIGVVGVVIFLLLAGLLVYSLFVRIKKEIDVSFIVNILILSFLIVSIFGHHIEGEEISLIFWFYTGIIGQKVFYIKIKKPLNIFVISLVVLYFLSGIYSFIKQIRQVDIFKYNNITGLYQKEVVKR